MIDVYRYLNNVKVELSEMVMSSMKTTMRGIYIKMGEKYRSTEFGKLQ